MRDRETDLFWEAFTQARQFHESNLDGWDVLFIMQHHAFPTRLLDWTETLATALYFAVCDLAEDVSRTAAIWILNPERLNNESWNKEDVGLIDPRNLGWDGKLREYFDYRDYMTEELRDDYSKGPVAIYPAQKSERMRAQAGRFTIHGRELAPLDEIYGPRSGVWRKVEVPCEAVQRAKEFLDISGVTEYRLFPDLDGLGRHLRTKYAVGPKVR